MSRRSKGGATGLDPEGRERLLRLLRSHRPADALEESHLAHVLDFVTRVPDPFDRRVTEGHLTGAAFVLDPWGRLLLCHHRRLDLWIQLGGHADEEREAHEVALREAREESGLPDLRFHEALLDRDGRPRLLDVDVHRIPAHRDEAEHDHLDLRFLLRTQRPAEIVVDPAESKALEWVSLEEAQRRGDPSIGRAIGRLRALDGAGRAEARLAPGGGRRSVDRSPHPT